MNEFLAELYNTAENIGTTTSGEDQVKLAQAQILGELVANEGLDLSKLSDADIVKIAGAVFGPNNEIVKQANFPPEMIHGAAPSPEDEKKKKEEEAAKEKEAMQAKLAEADLMGRLMAHSMVDELADIEKKAAASHGQTKVAGVQGNLLTKLAAAFVQPKTASNQSSVPQSTIEKIASAYRNQQQGAGASTAEADLDKLAEARAIELLKEAGYPVDQALGQDAEQQKLAEVNRRALLKLKEAGFPVE